MKLVERLAREFPEWPESRIYSMEQASDGDVIYNLCYPPSSDDEDYEYSGKHMALAEDWSGTVVTRAQWEAERERIAKMEKIESGIRQGEADAQQLKSAVGSIDDFEFKDGEFRHKETGFILQRDMRSEAQKQYDQELWDEAYMTAWTQMIKESLGSDMSHFNDGTTGSARMADAFMEERAKRMK